MPTKKSQHSKRRILIKGLSQQPKVLTEADLKKVKGGTVTAGKAKTADKAFNNYDGYIRS